MPGFLGVIGDKRSNNELIDLNNPRYNELITNEIYGESFYLARFVNNKFLNDKVFFENDKYIVITDGVLLNSTFLKEKYHKESISELLIEMYEQCGETFFEQIRGSYSCILYNKEADNWLIYTDHLGDKKVYYKNSYQGFFFGSRIYELTKILDEGRLDNDSCLCMLTLGYMVDDRTMVKDVKRLLPGHYVKINKGIVEVHRYFNLNNTPREDKSEEAIIEEMDSLFREAIRLQFEKDREYGYKHIASLSGGLDSRMVNFVAHDLGYKDILNYTFSQSNYLDEKIAKDIASDLNHEFIFKSLDDAKFLFDLEDILKINGGTSIYYGVAHSKNNLEKLNFKNYGMVHTGQLGDVVIGSFLKESNYNQPIDLTSYVYSTRYKDKLNTIDKKEYPDDEIFKMYNRGFNFALNGNLAFQEFTESMSPFCDVDFLQYCMNIPLKYRVGHNLYFKWIIKKYPKAAEYIYESIKAKITTPKVYIRSKDFFIRGTNKVLRKLNLPTLYGYNTKNGMNPFDYWYRTNSELKEFIDSYYKQNIKLLDKLNEKELKVMCENLYNNGITVEKLQVLTVLATVKLIIGAKL
ncbi:MULTISPECIES: asparagine synthase-related protein [Bacillus]|uniref:asparagine synthase-related protein n=1 Tax=Bacillus TaxID=1386 RepID=UPI000BEC2690|nr:asparagine synthase-related protein [Bacillus toyonensis]PDZ84482.1 asparagine synthase [Bacillus toyonensis]PEA71233.1 asparagine synthase [Bacillus toyonensis]PEP94673.1 asparagine synthase [Bacillus toyonensis]PFY24505.1 asparagine synthase [Bacillus toyonensis]PHC31786.1 asparagine synthase [Bacillus toyonensis]